MTSKTTPNNKTASNGEYEAAAMMYSASLSLTVFWVLTILKEAFKAINQALNIHKGIGPLLSLFVISMLVLFLAYSPLLGYIKNIKNKSGQVAKAFAFLVVATIVFTLMTAPLFYEPVVDLLK